MKLLGALIVAAATTFATPCFAFTVTSTVDFSLGGSDGAAVDLLSASGTDFHFETRSGFGNLASTVAPNVKYHAAADYSGDQALYSATDDGVFQLIIDAQPNRVFTGLTFGFGGFPNTTQSADWKAWTANFLTSFGNGTVVADGTSGALLTFSGLNTANFLLQFGTNPSVGLSSVTYTTEAAAVTPIPSALLLFGTSLVGLVALGRRKLQLR